MTDTTQAVENKVETAATQPETVVTPTTTEVVDYEAELARVNQELIKTTQEKDNYRKGLLKAKGKLPEQEGLDTPLTEDMETIIDRKVTEKLLSTKEAQLQAQKDATIVAMAKRNKELELALKNRGQITSPSAQGSNQEKPEVKTDNYFSQDQINALKAKGWDDKKIEEAKRNMSKGNKS